MLFPLAAAAPRGIVRPSWAALAVVALLAACGAKDHPASQTAAKVNKEEITVHQINFLLQQQRNLKPEQAEAAGRQILERLIDQQLALQKAEELKLQRDPRVVQQLDAARREVLARAYVDKVGEGAKRPTPEEVRQYYDAKPALFKERRIYSLQEVIVEARPEQMAALRAALGAAKNIGEFTDFLKSNDYRHTVGQAVRAAEQLPLQNLDAFARMKDGQAVLTQTPAGVTVVVLAGSRSQPIAEEQARPVIEQFLLNERKRKLAEDELKALRAASTIEYIGKFAAAPSDAAAPGTPPAPSAPPAAPAASAVSVLPVAAPAASAGLSDSDISKGMGLKK